MAFERQKNMDNRVGIIRGSVQVTETHIGWKNMENIKMKMSASS